MTQAKQAPELKPCPFCGNADLRISAITGAVFCEECGAEGPWSPFFDGDWNTRAAPTLAEAMRCPEVVALREALQQWRTAFWVADQFAVAIHDDEGKCYSIRAQDFHRMSDLYRAALALLQKDPAP